ncbi:MAG: DUF4062 domain-containing protein, partial [Caldilineaceae bacterium SB0665_bin_21]|nr:DUF4062 domain-containing protein [Caldilineaceae bacterium SB0665_bin_21]
MNKWNRCMRLYNENHLLVFVSSVTENLRALRQEIKKAITEFPVTEPWLFEDMPASTESPSDLYLRKVKEADLVIWLVGDETTQPVADEIHTCMIAGVRLLAFLLCMDNRCQTTRNLIEKAQKYAKWEEVKESDLLAEYVTRALHDEIIRGYRNPDPPKRRRRLKQKFNFSLAQIKQSWISLGVSETVAANLSEDPTVGLDLGDLGPGLHIVKGDQGSGKSLAAARHFQKSVKLALDDISSPYTLFVNERDLTSNLVEYIDQRANE